MGTFPLRIFVGKRPHPRKRRNYDNKIAEHSGFCFGVKQAIETAENVISEHTGDPDSLGVYSFGPLIHNQSVNDDLTAKGLVITDDLNNIPEGSTVIVRSHGEPESFYSEAKSRGLVITDATCPFVARIHKLVSEAAKAGKNIVIVGDRTHPEVDRNQRMVRRKCIHLRKRRRTQNGFDRRISIHSLPDDQQKETLEEIVSSAVRAKVYLWR